MTALGYSLSFCLALERRSFNQERVAVKRTGDLATGSYRRYGDRLYPLSPTTASAPLDAALSAQPFP